MRVLVIVVIVIVVVIVTWESKANSSSSLTELQTGTELGKRKQHARAMVWKVLGISSPDILSNTEYVGSV